MKYRQKLRQRFKNAEKLKGQPETPFVQVPPEKCPFEIPTWCTRIYKNNRYIVVVEDFRKTTSGICIMAMVQAFDDEPIKNHWSEMQRIKTEIFGDIMAIEYYPTTTELVDEKNVYWLCIYPEGVIPKLLHK